MSAGLTSPVARPAEPYLSSRQPTPTSMATTTKDTLVPSLPRGALGQKVSEMGHARCLTATEHHLQRILLGHAQHGKHGTQDGWQKGNHVKCCKREAGCHRGCRPSPLPASPLLRTWKGPTASGMRPAPQVILSGPPELLRDVEGQESLRHSPLDTERLASVCSTEEWGSVPGWNLLSTSSITWLVNRFPTATRMLLAACCQSQSSSCTQRVTRLVSP